MSQQELLNRIIQILNQIGIPYMLTGSLASSLQGEPRSTHDIDIIIAIQKSDIKRLVKLFSPSDFYLDEDSITNAIDTESMFNVINTNSGDKIDFWILTDESFDQSRFSRKIQEEFLGMKIEVSAPEDTILAKLKWAKLSGGSEKQFTDALRVYEVQYEKLDSDYLQKWVKELDIESLWGRLLDEAEIL